MRGVGVNTSSYVPPSPTGAAPTAVRYYEIIRAEFVPGSDVTQYSGALPVTINTGVSFEGRNNLLQLEFNQIVDTVSQFSLNDAVGITTTATTPVDVAYSYYIHDPDERLLSTAFDIKIQSGGSPSSGYTHTVSTLEFNQWVQITNTGSAASGQDLNILRITIPTSSVSSADFNWSIYFHKFVLRYKL